MVLIQSYLSKIVVIYLTTERRLIETTTNASLLNSRESVSEGAENETVR